MNILELLTQQLKGKNWSLEEKCRFIYLQTCLLFSYDERYNLTKFLPPKEKNQMIEYLKSQKLDLQNIQDNRIICHTYTKEVISSLIQELLNIDITIHSHHHTWAIIKPNNKKIKTDATIASDLARVKMNLTTYGYRPIPNYENFQKELKQIDQNIHYIKEDYFNHELDQIISQLSENHPIPSKPSDEFLIYKLQTIQKLFNRYHFSNYTDANFCISYLTHKIHSLNSIPFLSTSSQSLLTSSNWHIINLYPVFLNQDILYYILEKNSSYYHFYEISQDQAYHYTKHLQKLSIPHSRTQNNL